MVVNVIGTRGFPNIQGGVEKHCESLYPLIAARGLQVKVFRRLAYLNREQRRIKFFHKVKFHDLWTLRNKNFEAIIHSFLAAIICLIDRPDIVHIHNIGPSLVLPLLKLGRLPTVVTYHSPNYEHSKWGWIACKILKIGELFVIRWADQIIFVSKVQAERINKRNKVYIPNGVHAPKLTTNIDYLLKIGVKPNQYILAVARFVPEKGLDDLIKAFKAMSCNYKLLIAGDADHETNYSKNLRQMAQTDKRIILTGYITGDPLDQVYSHARLFVLPSHNEGLPLALLEAMSYGLSVLVSDIAAHREIGLDSRRYFRCGDIDDLRAKMEFFLDKELPDEEKQKMRRQIEEKYNWDKIAEQTIEVYQRVVNRNSR
ncbi:MAG: glycosyltransferase family 4 protein [bacterium]|nr:glycosyltransferase family 4 protein [bacterium]